jgi:aspartate 1-decarboxylase
MFRKMLRSKIHRAVVTGSNLEYEGSITVDSDLLKQADVKEYELVQVVNLNNGNRFETYTISGEPGSGEIRLNGAAARLVHPGDRIIIMAYSLIDEDQLSDWKPRIVLLDNSNRVEEILCK